MATDVLFAPIVMVTEQKNWLEKAWEEREEIIYRDLFGDLGPGIYPLDNEVFQKGFNIWTVDPRWLSIGVFESPPNHERNNWVYVSSGLSNAWKEAKPDPTGPSGLATEFIMQTTTRAPWALLLLRKLVAFQLLLSSGYYKGSPLLNFWDRMPPRGPIDGADSQLEALLIVPSLHFGGEKQLLSGKFKFLQFVGLTFSENEYGKENGFESLHEKLLATGASPVMDVKRHSIL